MFVGLWVLEQRGPAHVEKKKVWREKYVTRLDEAGTDVGTLWQEDGEHEHGYAEEELSLTTMIVDVADTGCSPDRVGGHYVQDLLRHRAQREIEFGDHFVRNDGTVAIEVENEAVPLLMYTIPWDGVYVRMREDDLYLVWLPSGTPAPEACEVAQTMSSVGLGKRGDPARYALRYRLCEDADAAARRLQLEEGMGTFEVTPIRAGVGEKGLQNMMLHGLGWEFERIVYKQNERVIVAARSAPTSGALRIGVRSGKGEQDHVALVGPVARRWAAAPRPTGSAL